ncbi:MAG: hypothetical protein ACP5L2_07945, partial [Conexivisphaera sp.]
MRSAISRGTQRLPGFVRRLLGRDQHRPMLQEEITEGLSLQLALLKACGDSRHIASLDHIIIYRIIREP